MNIFIKISVFLFLIPLLGQAQAIHEYRDSLVVTTKVATVVINRMTGKVDYRFSNGAYLHNTVAYVEDVHLGRVCTSGLNQHLYSTEKVEDSIGKGVLINIKHDDDNQSMFLIQHITLYNTQPYLLLDVVAVSKGGKASPLETRNISPLAILPSQDGHLFVPGIEPRILDMPFDNDDWVPVLERRWKEDKKAIISGISYECSSVYDNATMSGIVMGSVAHDFWKTGIAYKVSDKIGMVDSLNIFGGIATPDNPSLPAAYGGRDGTHDHAPHGTMLGVTVNSPVIYLCGLFNVRKAFVNFGEANAKLNGRLYWKGFAPVYWNSFGVENVLGHKGIMMPAGVAKISDFIHTLNNFNKYAKPVLSIDSYDQGIYTTELLSSLGKFAKKKDQQMGFYFIPFAIWTWKNSVNEKKMTGSEYLLKEVILKDEKGQSIAYKNGEFGAFPIDPTHPATRIYIINQLQKAKAINATFIKIDFLTGGSLESSVRYDPAIRSGMQAYNFGMKMLKHLIDSIMGPDIFITMAISPMFPSQYAHTRFVSTDVYSHLRDDQPGFPKWGSTEASLATGSHMWWMQGTLWPYTNLDVSIMQHFQNNPDLNEQEIKVRIYSMITMGSILGDGSDFRNKIAADRAQLFLNNKNVCAFFSNPKVFTPIKFADGGTMNQQISFYLAGDTAMLAMFNFDTVKVYKETFICKALGLGNKKYEVHDFLTDAVVGKIEKGQLHFELAVANKDALMVRLIQINE